MSTLSKVAATREDAYEAISAGYDLAKLLIEDGRAVEIIVREFDPNMTIRQRKFLHGPVLQQISEQARDKGQRYVRKVWKEHFRERFLGSDWVMRDGVAVEVPISSESLGIALYGEFIDKVIAAGATDWSVEFHFDLDEREAVCGRKRWSPRRPVARREEATA